MVKGGLEWCGVLELTKVKYLFSSIDIHSFGDQKIYGLYGVECHKVKKRPGWVCFGWVGQWSVGPWITEMRNFTDMADICVKKSD